MIDERDQTGFEMVPARHRSLMTKFDAELLDELRNFAFFVQYFGIEGVPDTVIGNLEEAIRRYLVDMRRKHNGGKVFPKAKGELRQGRPPKKE